MRSRIHKSLFLLLMLIPWGAYADSGGCPELNSNEPLDDPMYCHQGLQISVNQLGFAVIVPQMLLVETFPNYDNFVVEIIDPPMSTDTVTCNQVGMTLDVMVTDTSTGNSCWSEVKVEDKLDPIITCDTIILPCTVDQFNLPDSIQPSTLSDNCTDSMDMNLTFVDDRQALPCGPMSRFVYRIQRNWTATDESGNSSSCSQIILFEKGSLDSLELPDDITLYCPGANTDPSVTGEPTINGEPLANLCMIVYAIEQDSFPACGNTYKIVREFVIRDWCTGDMIVHEQDIEVQDTVPPVVTCPANVTINATANCEADYMIPPPSATDVCSDDSDITFSYMVDGMVSGQVAMGLDTGDHEIKIIARDPCNNFDTCTYTVTVVDNVAPVILCNDETVPLGLNTMVTVGYEFFDFSITDNCSAITDTAIRRVNSFCPGNDSDLIFGENVKFCCEDVGQTIMVEVMATDAFGNTNFCMFQVTVQDNEPPVITCPDAITLNCPADTTIATTGMAVATDNCVDVTVTYTDDVTAGICQNTFSIVRTFKATDAAGNMATCEQNITVIDDTDPIINCPSSVTVDCPADTTPASTGFATATDECNNPPSVTYSDVITPGSCPNTFTVLRTWVATDACDNTSTCQQTINVVDDTDPVIICPPNMILNCPGDTSVASSGMATATEECNAPPIITYSDIVTLGSCPNTFTVDRTWVATDVCGNSSSCVQTIQIVDVTSPIINCPGNMNLSCPADTSVGTTGSATATDECNTPPTVTYVDNVTPGSCPMTFTLERIWTATDACGNSASCTQTINVVDNTDPVLNCPGNMILNCPGDTSVAATGMATATDECNDPPDITYLDNVTAGACANTFTVNRVWTATDACGNSASCTQTIEVIDETDPIISCPADVTLNCPADTSTNNTGMATATDECNDPPDISYVDNVTSGPCDNEFEIERIWTAMDACGNTSTCIQNISVVDNNAPVITCPSDVTLDCPADTSTSNTGVATATDACATPVITYSDVVTQGSCPNTFSVLRTWIATDPCGNAATCTQNIVVIDQTDPIIICPSDTTIDCSADTTPAFTGFPTAMDECNDPPTVTYSNTIIPGSGNVVYTITRTWTATDACGNSATCDQVITVVDSLPPQITAPADITVFLTIDSCQQFVNVPPPTVSDVCGDVTVTNNGNGDGMLDASGIYPTGTTIVTYTATDGNGNSAQDQTSITVLDTFPPTITCPADTMVDCNDNIFPLSQFGMPTFDDNCPGATLMEVDSNINIMGCGAGEIDRIFIVSDMSGNTDTCIQRITITGSSQLDSTDFIWPQPVIEVYDCVDFEDIPLPLPRLDSMVASCGTVLFDSTVTSVTPATFGCQTFEVSYTVTDSCNFDPLTGAGQWTLIQTVGIFDTIAPVINPIAANGPYFADTSCMATVNLASVTATDNCNTVTISNNSPFAISNGANASGDYPGGNTDVTFFADDGCGNIDSFVLSIFVTDTVRPELVCIKTELQITDNLTVSINADTAYQSVDDNCAFLDDITVTFDLNDFSDTIRTWDCDDLGTLNRVWVYAIDAQGNVDSCESEFGIDDPNHFCPPTIAINLGGSVYNPLSNPIENAEVMLSMNQQMEMSNEDGDFMFESIPSNMVHRLDADRDDEYLNGVTAYDLSVLMRHVSGIDLLDDAYKYFAADVNGDENIDIKDVLSLRKLLLGIENELEMPVWQFFDAEFDLSSASNPFYYDVPNYIMVYHQQQHMYDANFIGVKTGDLDYSAEINLNDGDTRSQNKTGLRIGLQDDSGRIPVYIEGDETVGSAQFELQWKGDGEIRRIIPNSEMNFDESDYNHSWLSRNTLRAIWIANSGNVDFTQPICWIELSNENFSLNDWALSNDFEAASYDGTGEMKSLNLSIDKDNLQDVGFALYQNIPNPFNGVTMIRFNLPVHQMYTLEVFDVKGARLYSVESEGEKGLNQVELSGSQLNGQAGVLYYRLKTIDNSAVRKMIFGE